jgi:hypothetical protein
LEAEGVALARTRLTALADLVITDPRRALEQAVPYAVRAGLPESVRALLEEPVNARGDYEVLCVLPVPGRAHAEAPLLRVATVAGQRFQVFTFDHGLDYVTRRDVPLNGVAVPADSASAPPAPPIPLDAPRLLALDPNPARRLDADERAARAPGAVAALELGGEVRAFRDPAEAAAWADEATAALALETPEVPPTAESPYTEGRKRFLLMRVDFPDYQVDVFPTNNAVNHMRDMSNFLAQISYFKHIIAPPGAGTDITPVMRMSENAAAYDNGGLSKLYPEARTVARDVHGYDLNKYDFFFVCTGGQPSYSYAGLGYVGGVGYHLANGYFDVRTSAHEFGHNLGLGHANWWDTGGTSTIGSGSNEEYGDPFDTMGGSGGGNRHFSASFKNRLGWIPGTDALTVTTSGVYRLHAHDFATAPVGLRALRLNRASGDPYWIEFRQLWTGNKAMMNGINFRWAAGSSQLLDMTPGSSGGKDDHSLTVGRTFSEPTLNWHVTPLGLATTYPESMDVAIHFGPFPANQAPTALVSANATSASAGSLLTFSVNATDPNGDRLAYAWDFGDGDYSVDNQPVVTHSFSAAGEYCVHCAVSDLKGGVARDSVVVRIGNPSTFRISGRVLDLAGRPLAGMKVFVNASRYAFTDNEGTYTLAGLGAGSYTVQALEPVAGRYTFTPAFFNNPVAVGPSFTTADFIGSTNVLNFYTPILARASSWKYLDNGSNQGTAWQASAFNDTGWSNGVGPLGYPSGSPITTVIGYGPASTNKYITYYFRRAFTVSDPTVYTNLQLEVLRDDGVVVYLNGAEVFRDNMPSGAPTYTTLAVDAIEPDNYLQTNLSRSLLVPGTNVFAVEVHQASVTSSDIAFDLSLSGLTVSNAAAFNLVYLASPENQQVFTSPTNVAVTAYARSGAGGVNQVGLYVDGALVGVTTAPPYAWTLGDPAIGQHTLQAVAWFSTGGPRTSAPVVIRVEAPVPPPFSLSLVATGSTWRYLAVSNGAPAGWTSLNFLDSTWGSGRAQFGYGEGDEATVIPYGGVSNNKWITSYYRQKFNVADPSAVTNLAVRLLRDDGGIVYLNGLEVFRSNMPTGVVDHLTLASNAGDDGKEYFGQAVDPALLVPGTNLLAVEIHQDSVTSSDVSFDLGLDALVFTNNRPRGLWLTSPTNNTVVALPDTVTFAAQVVVGGTLGVTRVEFFADGLKVGETATSPYRFVWTEPAAGARALTAVATDTAGGTVTSAPVAITVAAPPLATALISFGETWKYLDDGSNPGTAWTGRTYDDRAWLTGAARLGYGGDGEVTTISAGTNASQRILTAYFRKSINLPNPAVFSEVLLRLVRDDGAAVYFNGREVYRNNLPAGTLAFNTLATNTVAGADETTPVEVKLSLTGLQAGTNAIAVEVHQTSITSSDAGFDLELLGLRSTNTSEGVYLTSPANGARFNAPASVPLRAFAASAQPVTLVQYFAGSTLVGQATASPYAATWSNAPAGAYTLTARMTYGGGLVVTSPPVSIVVGTPPPPIAPVFETLLPAGSDWRYWDNVAAVAENWQMPGFDDTAWPGGPARLGFGFDGERTVLTEGRITHYFRRWFSAANPGRLTELLFQLARDDGAVVYLNGLEVFRSNMPEGPVSASTLASTTVNTPDETTYFETVLATTGSGLVGGSNLVAVESHQSAANSSDAGFDLQLLAFGTTEGRVYVSTPAEGATFRPFTPIPIEAQALAPAGSSVTKVEFFVDAAKLGETLSPPHRWTWSSPSYGPHTILARATTSSGATLTSAPVNIAITREVVTATLIPSNTVWKYLDDGSNQGTNWAQPGYNDTPWASGPARLGYGGDGEATTIRSNRTDGTRSITAYFRRAFVVPGGAVFTNLTCRLVRDDGAVVWLNGRELYRSNMPTGTVGYLTNAAGTVSGADEQSFFLTSVAVTNLSFGTNLLAVEVHQVNSTSSDLGFNLELTGIGYADDSEPPLLSIVLADGRVELSWPDTPPGWRVYAAPSLSPPENTWTPLNLTPTHVGNQYRITLDPVGAAQFFQLGKP